MWHEMDIETYLAYPALRSGDLNEILRSPAHYKSKCEKELKVTPAMLTGSMLHKAILEPESLEESIVECPADKRGRKNSPTLEWLYFIKECYNDGILTKTPEEIFAESATTWDTFFRPNIIRLNDGDRDRIEGVKKTFSDSPVLRDIMENALTEATGILQVDPGYGDFKVKVRPDIVNKDLKLIADIKFKQDCRKFNIFDFGYDVQAALQIAAALENEGDNSLDQFIWITVETEPPYAYMLYGFNLFEDFHRRAQHRLTKALKAYSECLKTDSWESYDNEQIIEVQYPRWIKD